MYTSIDIHTAFWNIFFIHRMPLPKIITEDFQRKIPSSVFTSNPCRIQYCTQEIVVIREDLVSKMCRNTIHFPTSGEIPEHVSTKSPVMMKQAIFAV